MRRAAKRRILSGAMALAMAASVVAWAPVQAYAEGPAAVVTQTEESQAEENPAPSEEQPTETAAPAPEVTAEPTAEPTETAEPTAEPTTEPDAAEPPAETAQPAAEAAPTILDWQWVTDDDGIARNDTLDLSAGDAANDNGIAVYSAVERPTGGFTFEKIVAQLPTQITAQKSDGTVVTLEIDTASWTSDTYVTDADGKWPQYGSHLFTARLKDGTALDADAKRLQITVCLGDAPVVPVTPTDLDLGEHTENGLPNYGVRIVIPYNNAKYNNFTTPVYLRLKAADPNQEVVLERYELGSDNKYHLAADRQYNYDVNTDELYFKNQYSYVFKNNANEWKTTRINIENKKDENGKVVYVLRTSKHPDDYEQPGPAGGDVQYELYYASCYKYTLELNTNSANPYDSSNTWQTLTGVTGRSTGVRALPSTTAGQVETIRMTQDQSYDWDTQKPIRWNAASDATMFTGVAEGTNGSGPYKNGLSMFPEQLSASAAKNTVVIRCDGETAADAQDWDISNAPRIRVTLYAPEEGLNSTPNWFDNQFAFRAALYSYDNTGANGYAAYTRCKMVNLPEFTNDREEAVTNAYYYKEDAEREGSIAYWYRNNGYGSKCAGGPANTAWGIKPGQSSTFETYLEPGKAIVIFPAYAGYGYSYKVELSSNRSDGKVFSLDSVTGGNNSATWNEGTRTYTSGLITDYTSLPDSATGQEIVLHVSNQTYDGKDITFQKLTDHMRTLKVNLFDYTVPDNWHSPDDGETTAQKDAQLRFVSDSDQNTKDPEIDRITGSDRRAPTTGIVAKNLTAIQDADGNALYTLTPDFRYSTPFKTNLFAPVNETKEVTTPGWSLKRLGDGMGTDLRYSDEYQTTRYKFAYPNVNFQFKYDDATATYSYNSHTNHAQFDRAANTIYEYDHALGMGGQYNKTVEGVNYWWEHKTEYVEDTWKTQAAGFYPFDTYVNIDEDGKVHSTDGSAYGKRNPGYDADNTAYEYQFKPAVSIDGTTLLRAEMELDYHFGMSMQHQFTVPYDGKVKGQDMVFSFSGDDDMWLFVDGQLVLDLGGIHEAATGTINFTRGTYSINGVEKPLADVLTTYTPDAYAKSGAWAGGTDHSFQMFYLERGGTLSNLAISFNLPDVVVQAAKVWNDNGQTDLRQDVTLYLEQTNDGTHWTKVADSDKTIAKAAEGDALTVDWLMPMYDESGSKLTYRVREQAIDGITSEVSVKRGDTWISEKSADYADALAAGHVFQVVNTIPKKDEPTRPPVKPDEPTTTETPKPGTTPTPAPAVTPTPAPAQTPKPADPGTTKPTAAPTATPTPAAKAAKASATPAPAAAKIPQTGDDFPLAAAVLGMVTGAAGLAYAARKKKKQQ